LALTVASAVFAAEMPLSRFLVSQNTFISGAMTMFRNGLNHSLLSSNVSMLGDDAIGLVGRARQIAPSQPLGLGILAAFVRSRELRRRIKFAAQAQSPRLG
jgi:hypothetical protein